MFSPRVSDSAGTTTWPCSERMATAWPLAWIDETCSAGCAKSKINGVRSARTRRTDAVPRTGSSLFDGMLQRQRVSDRADVRGPLGGEGLGNPLGGRRHGYNSRTHTVSEPPRGGHTERDRRHDNPFPRHESVRPMILDGIVASASLIGCSSSACAHGAAAATRRSLHRAHSRRSDPELVRGFTNRRAARLFGGRRRGWPQAVVHSVTRP